MSTDQRTDGIEFELTCSCGYENFERIVVQRKPQPPVVTDFVACVGCKTKYWARFDSLTPFRHALAME